MKIREWITVYGDLTWKGFFMWRLPIIIIIIIMKWIWSGIVQSLLQFIQLHHVRIPAQLNRRKGFDPKIRKTYFPLLCFLLLCKQGTKAFKLYLDWTELRERDNRDEYSIWVIYIALSHCVYRRIVIASKQGTEELSPHIIWHFSLSHSLYHYHYSSLHKCFAEGMYLVM